MIHMIALRPRRCHDGGVEMGEQWSPHTAPAGYAEMPMNSRLLSAGKMLVTMGIRIPKVPHEVPVANASPQATKEDDSRQEQAQPARSAFHQLPDKSGGIRRLVMFLSAVANVGMRIAGTMAIKPFGMHSIASRKFRRRRAIG